MKIAPLPPNPKIKIDSETLSLMNEINHKFSQIEGCCLLDADATTINLLKMREGLNSVRLDYANDSITELTSLFQPEGKSTKELSNYRNSLLLGEKLIKSGSGISHILESIHKELLTGKNSSAGLFRTNPAWINDSVAPKSESKYVAPDDEEIIPLMIDLENYIAGDLSYPALINAGLIHAQFEMIHPFQTHNGLTGRILIHIYLLLKKKVSFPILQISSALQKNKSEYFNCLEDLEQNNNWNGWVKFFLEAIAEAGSETLWLFQKICKQKEKDLKRLLEKSFVSTASIRLLNYITTNPIFSIPQITSTLGYTKQTMNLLIKKFEEEKLITEISGKQRYRTYSYKALVDILLHN